MYELSKNDTKMIQGISVLAMVCLHLFDRLDYIGIYEPLLYFCGYPVCFYFAQLSDFCVMGFAFCSGYAHMRIYSESGTIKEFYFGRLKHLFKFYLNYWVVIAVFTSISVVLGKASFMPGGVVQFLGNLTAVNITYNISWWYVFTYAIIAIVSPLILRLIEKRSLVLIVILFFAVYMIAYYVRYHLPENNWVYFQFGKFGMTVFEYILGTVFCKKSILSKGKAIIDERVKNNKCIGWISLSLMLLIMLLVHTLLVSSMIIAPITGLIIIIGFKYVEIPKILKETFLFFGRHSTNIWLVHLFFYDTLFVGLVFVAKWPPLIYTIMLILSVMVSVLIQKIMKVGNILQNNLLRHEI